MDEIVTRAMQKWPNVPHCFDWLGLDGRGSWYMRDDLVQKKGGFLKAKGERLTHQKLIDFIGRNYQADQQGRWYFQNGPQRVFVELECTPWVWRVRRSVKGFEISTHTGILSPFKSAYQDEAGLLYFETQLGVGLVHSMDMWPALEWLEHAHIEPEHLQAKDIPSQFGFVRSPANER